MKIDENLFYNVTKDNTLNITHTQHTKNTYFGEIVFYISIKNDFVGIYGGKKLYGKLNAPSMCVRTKFSMLS